MKLAQVTMCLGLASALMARPSSAATYRVPEDYPTIQAAIDAAALGDSVLVGPGTWAHRETRILHLGSVNQTVTSCGFLKAPLWVIGIAGPDATIVDAGGSGPGFVDTFILANDQVGDTVLEGMTITGAGTNSAGVIGIDSDRVVLRFCKVNHNIVGPFGAAVIGSRCDLAVFDSEVSFNQSGSTGGIDSQDLADVELRRTRIEGNQGRGLTAAWTSPGPEITIMDCAFIRNRGSEGGGAYLGSAMPMAIERNLFLANVATAGEFAVGGGLLLGTVSGSIRFNTFAYDSSAQSGGGMGIFNPQAPLIISNNTFVGCHCLSGYNGAAVVISQGPAFEFSKNILAYSTGSAAAGSHSNAALVGGCNAYWSNAAGDYHLEWQPHPTDFFLDPEFCDLEGLDFTVSDSSPCSPSGNPSCGQVGAWGVGCGSVNVTETSWGRLKSLYR